MRYSASRVFFDQRDHELLSVVNELLERNSAVPHLQNLLHPYLHPRGIKEMAASKGIRIAYAVIHVLDSLEVGQAADRLNALRSLQNEVVNAASSHLRRNTARVLLEIMKELVRSRYDYLRQLQLAHDFRTAASGKPLIIRKLLRRYHLLEMPEEWNQMAFDDHVHDSSTKGRKSPSHLIMDAWIKGIRRLTVIYYNHVQPEAAAELLEAAEIMGLTVRIGIEFSATFRNQYVQFIWVPIGFKEKRDFLSFLSSPSVEALMREGRRVSEYQQGFVFSVLEEFNNKHRFAISEKFGIEMAPVDPTEFAAFVGSGQASLLHLAKCIHSSLLPLLQARIVGLRDDYATANDEERERISRLVEEMNALDSEGIVERYLRSRRNPSIPNPNIPINGSEVPGLLKLSPLELMERLKELHAGCHIRLNLSNLLVEDVLELLYDCKGIITHLEMFNLKDFLSGKASHYADINQLQLCINNESFLRLKEVTKRILKSNGYSVDRAQKLKEIIHNTTQLHSYYRQTPLKAHIGSDSTGHSRRLLGMGLVIKDSIPGRAKREFKRSFDHLRLTLPMSIKTRTRTTYFPSPNLSSWKRTLIRLLRHLPGLSRIGYERKKDWEVDDSSVCMQATGNIIALGRAHEESGNKLSLDPPAPLHRKISLKYLNSGVVIALKIIFGFVPALATFMYTQDWWLLSYFGVFIWFAITGLRNILQSLLGGAGLRHSPLLRMNDYVSWERVADSLLYTGISVPLLEYFVKILMLDQWLGINMTTDRVSLYAVMSLVNGVYISGHNIIRGLPRGAIVGNFFRSILNIPLAIALNAGIGQVLRVYGVPGIDDVLQKWAAIISKTASDCVAAVIEGAADRYENIRLRIQDYESKLAQFFGTYAKLELLFPKHEVVQMLESPEEFMRALSAEARDLYRIIIINALDFLYFYMYQPRARIVLRMFLKNMSDEERMIFVRAQSVLQRIPEISMLFVNGLIGPKFSRALAFYLEHGLQYLAEIEALAYKHSEMREGFVRRSEPILVMGSTLLPREAGTSLEEYANEPSLVSRTCEIHSSRVST